MVFVDGYVNFPPNESHQTEEGISQQGKLIVYFHVDVPYGHVLWNHGQVRSCTAISNIACVPHVFLHVPTPTEWITPDQLLGAPGAAIPEEWLPTRPDVDVDSNRSAVPWMRWRRFDFGDLDAGQRRSMGQRKAMWRGVDTDAAKFGVVAGLLL